MKLTSSAFSEGGQLPAKYTCEGENISPPLSWTAVPAAARSLALIVEDPDTGHGTFAHWVVYHLRPGDGSLAEAVPHTPALPDGAMQGKNDFGRTGYNGPCPPSGTHRYFFRLYALDTHLQIREGATREQVDAEMKGHILAETALMVRYGRSG